MSLTITPLTRTLVVYLIEGEVNIMVVVNKSIQIFDVEVRNGDCLLTINGLNFIGKDQQYINEYLATNQVRYIDKDVSVRNIIDIPLLFYMSDNRRCIKNTNAIIVPMDKSGQTFDIIPAESFITFIHDREWYMYTDIADVNNTLEANKGSSVMTNFYFIEADDDRQINRQYEQQAIYVLNNFIRNSVYNNLRYGVEINTYKEINCIVRQPNRALSNSKPIVLPVDEYLCSFSVIPKDCFIVSLHNEPWYTFMKKSSIDELLTKHNNNHYIQSFQYLRKEDIKGIQLQHQLKADYERNKKRRKDVISTMPVDRIVLQQQSRLMVNMSIEQIESHNSNNRKDNMSHQRILQHCSSDIISNMPPERVQKQRMFDQTANMSEEQIENHRSNNTINNMSLLRIENHRSDDRIEFQTESQQLQGRKRKRNNQISSTTKQKHKQRNLSKSRSFDQNERHRVTNTIEGLSSDRIETMSTRQFTLQRSRDILLKQQKVLNDRLDVVMARKARLKVKSLNMEWNKVCQYCSYVHLSSSSKLELSLCCANNKMNMIKKFNLVPLSNDMIGLFMNHIKHLKDCDIYYNNKLSLAITGN